VPMPVEHVIEVRQRAAIDELQGSGGAPGMRMDVARQLGLPGTRLPGDQDRTAPASCGYAFSRVFTITAELPTNSA
jgi:hypothetical protein